MTETKKKIAVSASCRDGKHRFTVTRWNTAGIRREAVEMRCQYCLYPIDMQQLAMKEFREAEGMDS